MIHTYNSTLTNPQVSVKKAAGDVYAAIIDEKLAVKLGPGDWSPNTGPVKTWKLASSGTGFAVWEYGQA